MSQFIIDSYMKLKEKLEMVQSLGDIEIATKMIEEQACSGMSIIDSHYEKLGCQISPVETYVIKYPKAFRVLIIPLSNSILRIPKQFLICLSSSNYKMHSKSKGKVKAPDINLPLEMICYYGMGPGCQIMLVSFLKDCVSRLRKLQLADICSGKEFI